MRWIRPGNLHITILSPWFVDNKKEVVSLLAQKIFGFHFPVLLESIRFMPPDRPKFIWAFGHTPEELIELRQTISEVLKHLLEKRKYVLHTTIGSMHR